ncbi:hypothetical protein SO802_018697 [Lithocarpus litseifolius]|uniref:Uncharacterized protein n=1 Tax=Lithocarpus litseifolius TaxID=425828 RepID=A0AAW2CQS0_9ROSI
MIYLWFVIWICINSCFAQQYYDPSDCSSEPRNGSRYECQYSFQNSCPTFLVYRANRYFQTISSILDLFKLNSTEVLQRNSVTSSDEILKSGKRVKYLVTYPFIEGDETGTLSKKFSIYPEDLWVFNHLEPKPTVFPNTTVLIPLTKFPVMDFSVPEPPPPTPAFLPTISNGKKPKSTKSRNLYMAISIAGAILYIFVTTKWRAKLTNIGTSAAVGPVKEMDGKDSVRGWVAPEYLQHGSTSEKVDIFAFGVILLELISAREDLDGKSFKESITFLGGASEGGCFEQLRSFMDPSLKDDYPLMCSCFSRGLFGR